MTPSDLCVVMLIANAAQHKRVVASEPPPVVRHGQNGFSGNAHSFFSKLLIQINVRDLLAALAYFIPDFTCASVSGRGTDQPHCHRSKNK